MLNKNESNSFINSCITFITFSIFFVTAALLINFFVPGAKTESEETANALVITDLTEENEEEFTLAFQDYFAEVKSATFDDSLDNGLKLYRQPLSRAAVEWFYFQITGDKNVSQAILTEAEANDIPISLAFALAYTESSYNAQAVNKNSNKTIDRGLFQLNNNSFPNLTEADFFDPYISSKYGMSHLRFCLNTAGNEVSALAMYNAGTNRVRSNKTPQSTLNYVGKIMAYQKMVEQLFAEQVLAYFEAPLIAKTSVAYVGK